MTRFFRIRGRTRRGAVGAVAVTDRDLDLLVLIGLCRYLGTDQVSRDLFPSADRARRRLRRLFDGGLLTVTLVDSRRPNLVSLTRRGRGLLEARRPEFAERVGLGGGIRLAGVDHHLAVVDTRLYAAALGARRRAPLVAFCAGVGEEAKRLHLDALHLQPDGLATFATPTGPLTVAVEADCGTETLPVFDKKLEKYVRVAREGRIDALWIVVAAGEHRQRKLGERVVAHGLSAWARVLSHSHVLERPVRELPDRLVLSHQAECAHPPPAPTGRSHSGFTSSPHPSSGHPMGGVDGRGRR